jgi:hypothetical protein
MDLLNKILEAKKVSQDKDVKDKDGTQPAKYYAGDMSKSTKDKRDAHFKAKKSGPAPGDASAKTKKSKHTMKFDRMFNEDKGLDAKAKKSGISKSILKKVYDRGLAAYKTGHRPGATAPQWAMARVNSFITKGKGTWGGADKDLAKQVSEWNEMEEACWAGYKQVGMKKKGNKEVPNCVPEETVNENVAVKQAELKAKQVEEMESLKDKQEKELESLKLRHERENEKLSKEKEGESEREKLSNESIEENYDGDMAQNSLENIVRNANNLKGVIKKDGDYPAWWNSKLTKADDYLDVCHDYLMSELSQSEQIEEGKYVSDYRDVVDVIFKKIKSKIEKDFEKNQEKGIAIINTLGAMVGHKVTDKGQEKHKLFLKFGEERDYKKEYENYHSDPKQIKRRAKRNEARRSLKNSKKLTADKDVHHKDNNPMNNDKSNLSIVSQNYNRKEPRMRDKLKEKGCLPNGKRK